ncbi:MAG TPA: relaxase/mobilization nuclease RlxS, partial [Fimbriimonadaceae bacterium]|nr:relaxase/mobilization nuclease RlxS [Fimbriimonadaceae bacterium]
MQEEDFEPRLGRIRAPGSPRGRRYLHAVLAAAARAGALQRGKGRRFDGSRIGRGSSVGRILASRDRFAGLRSRRAIVKTRLMRLGGKGFGAARAHLRYIQRDGVTREGEPGRLYSTRADIADGKAFLERSEGDRHQFRFIVSVEDGAEYDDLKPLIRRFMQRMEQDLGTSLDWVAADHVDTAHPHTHIILRGMDDRGENLIIAPEYISRGMRERVAELVSLDLGPRTDKEIEARLRLDVDAERLTGTDRRFLREAGADRIVSVGGRTMFEHSVRAGRLRKLAALGLAENMGGGQWRLEVGLEERLLALGERGDIIRTMQRALAEARIERAPSEQTIFGADASTGADLVGRVVERGLSDELRDRHYLVVDGIDGRAHYVDLGRGDRTEPLPIGAIVRISRSVAEVRATDRKVAEIAAAHGGRYSVDLHLGHEPLASGEHARAHVRRLEAIRRVVGGPDRHPDGSWAIGADHLQRAQAYEKRMARDRPVAVAMLSPLPLERLSAFDGATWLDEELTASEPLPLREAGFGREVRTALAARQAWLIGEGLAEERGGDIEYRPDALATLRRRELLRVATAFSSELQLPFAEAQEGSAVAGRLDRRVDLVA